MGNDPPASVVVLADRRNEPTHRRGGRPAHLLPSAELVRILADRVGVDREEARSAFRKTSKRSMRDVQAWWSAQFSTLLLLNALEHAADCGDTECERCENILRRLEEPDLFSPMVAARELERLREVEGLAREFFLALDSREKDRGVRSSAAAARLRDAVDHEEDLVTRSNHTLQQKHRIGYESLGLGKRACQAIAKREGIAEPTVYKYRNLLLAAGPEAVDAARANLPPPSTEEHDLKSQIALLRQKVRSLEQVIAFQAEELLFARVDRRNAELDLRAEAEEAALAAMAGATQHSGAPVDDEIDEPCAGATG